MGTNSFTSVTRCWPGAGKLLLLPLLLVFVLSSSLPVEHVAQALHINSRQQSHRQETTTTTTQLTTTTTIATSNLPQTTTTSPSTARTSCNIHRCTQSEYSAILKQVADAVAQDATSILRKFRQLERAAPETSNSTSFRRACVGELVALIKELAANEIEMKTVLQFAAEPQASDNDLSSTTDQLTGAKSSLRDSLVSLDFAQMKLLQSQAGKFNQRLRADRECKEESQLQLLNHDQAPARLQEASQTEPTGVVERSQTLTKLVAQVDHWLAALERFTLTQEWSSLMRVFDGLEDILSHFAQKSVSASKLELVNASSVQLANNSSSPVSRKVILTEDSRDNLPRQVLVLTSSLNSLFPWHVWPWNNQDLFDTIDTFLSHGIFAFNKSIAGPNRLIDLLPHAIETLFQSSKLGTFPRKCDDWSKVICDPRTFYDQLVLGPLPEDSNADERNAKLDELLKSNRSLLIQELACIMFRSTPKSLTKEDNIYDSFPLGGLLAWDRLVTKGIKLMDLAQDALTEEQWVAIYGLTNQLWSNQKVTDRVIMVGRVVQLLTNCHVPKEVLNSALWKDIYKYKNLLNQMLDIIIEELNRSSETGNLTISQVALGSRSLHVILEKVIRFLPNLINALTSTVTEGLPDLVEKFFNEKALFFKVPCKGASFSDIIKSLGNHRVQLGEIEELVCQQLSIRPNITMAQINNLTNDFLSMALNFSGISSSLNLPRMLSSNPTPLTAPIETASHKLSQLPEDTATGSNLNNVTSIVDEMAANPRLSQVVAILQSSPLDPPEIHAELPELDWVEAGTSVALLYESIQKLLSYEGVFNIFPEVENFQIQLNNRTTESQKSFRSFSKQDPIRLTAYFLDALMPIALRTFKPAETLNGECLSSFRDIFSDDAENKVTRQWQCFISSATFAPWAINRFIETFNEMYREVLDHVTQNSSVNKLSTQAIKSKANNNTSCILFDGSISMMLDNLPQSIDLALETVLLASTTSEQQLNLYDIMCSSNFMLDPFNERAIELKATMKDKMCHLFNKNSTTNCARVLKFDQWRATMHLLNTTWFESSAISLKPSFREVTLNIHKFLELFGRFKPDTMSDSLLGRILNVNSFWTLLMNRIAGIVDKYQEKRFEYALQTLTPIIYDNLPSSDIATGGLNEERDESKPGSVEKEVRESLITTILGAKAILNYLEKQQSATGGSSQGRLESAGNYSSSSQLEKHMQFLFNWLDQYSLMGAEVVLRTVANDIGKLESIFKLEVSDSKQNTSDSKVSLTEAWRRLCDGPIDKYMDIKQYLSAPIASMDQQTTLSPIQNGNDTTTTTTTTTTTSTSTTTASTVNHNSSSSIVNPVYLQLTEAKESICKFNWSMFYETLGAKSNKMLAEYPDKQLTRIMLTKWGQVFDTMFIESKHIKQLPKFFYMDYWQLFREKIPQISPLQDQPSNLIWIWIGFERVVNAMDGGTNQTSVSLYRILDQLNCGLDAVKGGMSWENIANIYSDKQDILAAHSIINNGFALASIGINTFFGQRKFQRFLDQLVKPKAGLNAFCKLRNRDQLETIFSVPEGEEFIEALESFQELICDTNFESLAQNINPISVCYQTNAIALGNSSTVTKVSSHPLADIMDRFFKLASLAVLDAKLVVASEAKPPLLDTNQWVNFWSWWSEKKQPEPKSNIALAVVRVFQIVDAVNYNHVIWKALFRSVRELTDVAAYLLRAFEKKQLEIDFIGATSRLNLVKEAAGKIDSAIRSNKQIQHKQLASTLSNVMFPEVNNFISFKTFKQLRYIRTISNYFVLTPEAQEATCRSSLKDPAKASNRTMKPAQSSQPTQQLELLGYKLNTDERLLTLLCHYHSSQWLTALNIVVSSRTASLPKKINFITKYLSIFIRYHQDPELRLESFIHNQQLENIESTVNSSVAYLLSSTSSASLKSQLSLGKISNISWHSFPDLLDSIDRNLCATRYEQGTFRIPAYEPRKLELETVFCKMPKWSGRQVYEYLSENFDLQNMISLISTAQNSSAGQTMRVASNTNTTTNLNTCVTPFKFASRWLKIGQELMEDISLKINRDKIRKCTSLARKGQSIYSQFLRYLNAVNGILSSVDELTSNNSWDQVKKTWAAVSYVILNRQV